MKYNEALIILKNLGERYKLTDTEVEAIRTAVRCIQSCEKDNEEQLRKLRSQ